MSIQKRNTMKKPERHEKRRKFQVFIIVKILVLNYGYPLLKAAEQLPAVI